MIGPCCIFKCMIEGLKMQHFFPLDLRSSHRSGHNLYKYVDNSLEAASCETCNTKDVSHPIMTSQWREGWAANQRLESATSNFNIWMTYFDLILIVSTVKKNNPDEQQQTVLILPLNNSNNVLAPAITSVVFTIHCLLHAALIRPALSCLIGLIQRKLLFQQ